jgi:hypothetical protein
MRHASETFRSKFCDELIVGASSGVELCGGLLFAAGRWVETRYGSLGRRVILECLLPELGVPNVKCLVVDYFGDG